MQTQNNPKKLIFFQRPQKPLGIFFSRKSMKPYHIIVSGCNFFFFLFSFSKSDGVPSALLAGAVISFSPILNDDNHWTEA